MDDPLAPANGKYASRQVSCSLPDTFAYMIDMYCERLQIKRTDLFRDAIVEYMKARGITVL